MTKFIANNWVAIIITLAVILVGLVITLIIMDRKDKKLIANYKAELKALKAKPAEPVVREEAEIEDEEQPVVEPVKKAPAKKTGTKTADKKPATKTTARKTTTKKSK